jgi:hypothetical protein
MIQGKIIADKLHGIGNKISEAMNNAERQGKLNQYGYMYKHILEREQFRDKTAQVKTDQVNKYGNQYAATELLTAKKHLFIDDTISFGETFIYIFCFSECVEHKELNRLTMFSSLHNVDDKKNNFTLNQITK